MRPRTLLILLATVLVLGAFIWFYERRLPSSEERAELEKKVLRIDKGDVTAVTIDSREGPVRLERAAAAKPEKGKAKEDEEEDDAEAEPSVEWRITRPIAARADVFAVDRLLDQILDLEKSRTLDEVNPREVGLDKPRATVRLTLKEGEKVLKLGAGVPTGGSLIAGIEGEKGAYVVSEAILSEVERKPGEWRDRLMFRNDRETVQRLTLSGAPGGPVTLVRRPDGFWMEKPVADRADRDLVDGLLSDLMGLTAERFVDDPRPPAELGLAPPRETIQVVFSGGVPPVRIDLGTPVAVEETPEGQASGELTYARIGNTRFEARTRLAESAQRAPVDWRARQLSAFEVFDVESFTVRAGQAPLEVTRAEPDWKRGDTTISFLPVSDFLSAVTGARADRLLTPQEAQAMGAGLAKPVLTVELRTKDKGNETLTLYPPIAAGAPARASGRQVVLLLPADTLKEIQEKLQEVRTAKPATAEE